MEKWSHCPVDDTPYQVEHLVKRQRKEPLQA
jgi:hypothetical protein